ncbi:MAG TPA: hypothetical protein DD670_13900 [Planctomycetaceae bacterium]|nr:hypothetical protein [Planctomycetaceae bacterium]
MTGSGAVREVLAEKGFRRIAEKRYNSVGRRHESFANPSGGSNAVGWVEWSEPHQLRDVHDSSRRSDRLEARKETKP